MRFSWDKLPPTLPTEMACPCEAFTDIVALCPFPEVPPDSALNCGSNASRHPMIPALILFTPYPFFSHEDSPYNEGISVAAAWLCCGNSSVDLYR